MSDHPRVPPHLRRYVVEQDYAQYSEIDQAVWRFVLLQTYARLCKTAHPAYREGLGKAGISVERIPRVPEVASALERFGWSAVCVDGFIPPRAFQEFQAASILPIAADMRTKDHLVYTPAPDIIHEAAGHAPFLSEPRYAAYLRAIGEVGKKAFASPEDARVYAAIFALSEVKETHDAPPERVRAAELALERALGSVSYASEASLISRLYWWTAEYGLVGTPRDYRLYGAGLLSSLWESHTCHAPDVQKLPFSASCVDMPYDITRTQPQLFVARDFEQLFEVLTDVDQTLSYRKGGDIALAAAFRSQEVATFHLTDEVWLSGQLLSARGDARVGVLQFVGPVALGAGDHLLEFVCYEHGTYRLPLGPLADGTLPNSLTRDTLASGYREGSRCHLRFASGIELSGALGAARYGRSGQLVAAHFQDYELRDAGAAGFVERGRDYTWCVAPKLLTAHAGPGAPGFFPADAAPSAIRVPHARDYSKDERALLALFERARSAFEKQHGSAVLPAFEAIHAELRTSFDDEWLLRWNLLESLCRVDESGQLAVVLEAELAELEVRFCYREPIATGLRYLAALVAGRPLSYPAPALTGS